MRTLFLKVSYHPRGAPSCIRVGSLISPITDSDLVGPVWYKFKASGVYADLKFEGFTPCPGSPSSTRFGSLISPTTDSDPVGPVWYKCIASGAYADFIFKGFISPPKNTIKQPLWMPDLDHH